jgi:2-polyprenyl-3-methyl-5-hydroxy-6-metoxy-1,4-benzoquinol methylase
LYEQLEDPDYSEGAETRILQMRWLLDLGKGRNPNARTLLEVGSGIGLLIEEARKRGLEAVGIEPSRSLVETARNNGVELIRGLFPHPAVAGRRFDLIYVVDVIEHVSDPVQLMKDCAAALTPDGVLIMVTPDIESTAARVLKHK